MEKCTKPCLERGSKPTCEEKKDSSAVHWQLPQGYNTFIPFIKIGPSIFKSDKL